MVAHFDRACRCADFRRVRRNSFDNSRTLTMLTMHARPYFLTMLTILTMFPLARGKLYGGTDRFFVFFNEADHRQDRQHRQERTTRVVTRATHELRC